MAAVRVTTLARRAMAETKKLAAAKCTLKGEKTKRKLNFYSTHYNRTIRYFRTISFENLFQQYLQMEAKLLQVLITTARFPQLTIIQGKIKNRYSRKN